MLFLDQLCMTAFRNLFAVALQHQEVGTIGTLSVVLDVHKVDGADVEGATFIIHTANAGVLYYWLSVADVMRIDEHYPDLRSGIVQKDFATQVLTVHPHNLEGTVKFQLYPTADTLAKETADV